MTYFLTSIERNINDYLSFFTFSVKKLIALYNSEMSSASQIMFNILVYNHFTLYYLTSIARYVKDGSSARKIVNWLSSVALFKSHLCFPPTKGPKLMDKQLGSI